MPAAPGDGPDDRRRSPCRQYQGYNVTYPDAQVTFADYATGQPPSELADAYANNYVDSVRLIAISDRLVPRSADWEGARPLLELAVKPLPRPIRPSIDRQPVLTQTFAPSEEYAYAMPLVATSFLAGGILVVVLASLGAGVLVGVLDRRMTAGSASAGTIAVVVVAIVSFPSVLRGGVPAGVTYFLVDVIGMWVVARTGLRRAPAVQDGGAG